MARYNKIYAGPVSEPTPQVKEALASVALTPGSLAVLSAGAFALAGVASTGQLFVIEEQSTALKSVDVAWAQNDLAVGLTLLPAQLVRVLVPTGNNLAEGAPLELVANGKLALAAGEGRVVAYAHEAYNNNTGSDQLVTVRVAVGYIVAPEA